MTFQDRRVNWDTHTRCSGAMKIRKRNGIAAEYEREKIERVIGLAFESVGRSDAAAEAARLAAGIEQQLLAQGEELVAVESIQVRTVIVRVKSASTLTL